MTFSQTLNVIFHTLLKVIECHKRTATSQNTMDLFLYTISSLQKLTFSCDYTIKAKLRKATTHICLLLGRTIFNYNYCPTFIWQTSLCWEFKWRIKIDQWFWTSFLRPSRSSNSVYCCHLNIFIVYIQADQYKFFGLKYWTKAWSKNIKLFTFSGTDIWVFQGYSYKLNFTNILAYDL